MIQLHDKQFVPFISAKEIEFAITKMVQQVEDDFIDETPVFIGVLNGSFMVVSDFMKQYTKPCEVKQDGFYEGTSSTNEVKQLIGLNQDLTGRSVVILRGYR
jgi:hypoxanthine phosphoribosyltransferase